MLFRPSSILGTLKNLTWLGPFFNNNSETDKQPKLSLQKKKEEGCPLSAITIKKAFTFETGI